MCPVTARQLTSWPYNETNGRPLIDLTSLFSAPEAMPRYATAASPPPTTNPFQAPDFGENETFLIEDAQAPEEFYGTRR
ncbi:hypothetical protein KWI83_33855 [Streptomyces sp. TRM70350]|nr:hypothetical protein [Streptomyces sp. TRM70350]